MPDPRDILPQPPWEGPPVPKFVMKTNGRARRIIEDTLFSLSQQYGVEKPKIVFQPMEYAEARFRAPRTIRIEETWEKLIDTAKALEWDKFLRTVVAHEFKHYLQYLELGRPLTTIPSKEYEKYEREAERFGTEFGGMSYREMSYMIALANGISSKYLVEEMPMERAIQAAEAEFPSLLLD